MEGEVEGDGDAEYLGLGDEFAEVGEGAELGMDGGMPAFGRADGPGAADVTGFGDRVVVFAFAVGLADGVDGGQIEYVEAHFRDVGQTGDQVVEVAVRAGMGATGTWEDFVPGAELGLLGIDDDLEDVLVGAGVFPVGMALHEVRQLVGQGDFDGLGDVLFVADGLAASGEGVFVRRGCALGGLFDEVQPDEEVDGDVLGRIDPFLQVALPGGEVVGPGLDGVLPTPEPARFELCLPAVVDVVLHRGLGPFGLGLFLVEEHGGQGVVAVHHDVGGDLDDVVYNALDRITATLDLGPHQADLDPVLAFGRQLGSGTGGF